MQRILVIDNYDSFVNNIIHLIKENSDAEVERVYNDKIDYKRLEDFNAVILSPGPGLPSDAGSLLSCLRHCAHTHKILGICLGHQAIYEFFGGRLLQLSDIRHGCKATINITDRKDPLLRYLPSDACGGLYNSWAADPSYIPDELVVSSIDDKGAIMSLYHKSLPIHGIQFHPESIMSNCGKEIVKGFIDI